MTEKSGCAILSITKGNVKEVVMGIYLNPGSQGFERIIRSEYVDKTGMIALLNERIDTTDGLVCVSRPRRFGKSFAAQMLSAYYDHTCDSHALFDGLEISRNKDYEKHLNRYNVINLDMAGIISMTIEDGKTISDVPRLLTDALRKELIKYRPDITETDKLANCFIECVELTGRKFIFIIDEWDAIIREAKNDPDTQMAYLTMLRGWFKNSGFTPKVVAAAYMTGILPIKKDGSESAISDFREFTILDPGPFTAYTGFDEKEVKSLCSKHKRDFAEMKQWYDGYAFEGYGEIYNPYSVMEALKSGECSSHWKKTSAAENLITYINMDEDGLQADILKLLSGENLRVNTRMFKNDFEHFSSKDDVLTLLIHLGYLSYNKKSGRVKIPNEEVRLEFIDILEQPRHTKLISLIKLSEKLLSDTLAGNEKEVAEAIEKVRETNYAPQFYNNEQALRYAIKFAYIVCVDRFMKIEELPSGHGLADVVFVPKKDTAYPAIIIELKWDKDEKEALDQINDKKYDAVLEGYTGGIVKVGISYDTDSKVHSCKIERV